MPNSFPGQDAGLRRIPLFCLLALAVGLFVLVVWPASSRATRDQSQALLTKGNKEGNNRRPEFVPGEVLVRFKSEAVARSQSKSSVVRSDSAQTMSVELERFEGSEIVEGLRIARVPAEETMSAIEALSKQPDVLYAEPNYIMHPDNTPNDPNFPSLYAMTKIGAPQAWDTTIGSASVVVGVVDEGIDLVHQDLQANVWNNPAPGSISGITGDLHGYNFVDNTGTIPGEDHASHVAGIVGAKGNNNIGVVGVNWNVGLMSLRALDPTGGSTSDIIRAYDYARQMRDRWLSSGGTQGANVRILNNSYGGEGFSQAAFDAISALNTAGILFVASAGNDACVISPSCPVNRGDSDIFPHYPSGYNLPNVISVASTTSSDGLSSFSNFGQTVSVGAPGSSILSTTPSNTYSTFSGTSMASPHVAGAAALICAANPNVSLQQLKALLIFNGDMVAALSGKTLTGRRLNVAKSLQALTENAGGIDVTPPGAVGNFRVNSQSGRSINLAWTASGDDGASGQASLYQFTFTDATTGAVISLLSALPLASGAAQSFDVRIPYRHTSGTIRLRVFDNLGNEGPSATVNVSVPIHEADPYATTLGIPVALSTGGSLISGLNGDDKIKENVPLPFAFPFFGQAFSTVTISSNGNLYFSPAPKRSNGDADDAASSAADLPKFKMIAGLWDDLYLGTDQRADAGVYAVQPDANRIIYRWQGVPCNPGPPNGDCLFGGSPVNFEIELRNDGHILTRYGSGNTNIFPVVGLGAGEPDAYVINSHTSEQNPISLTNAQEVNFQLRAPLENSYFFVSQHYRDFLGREPDSGGLDYWSNQITQCGVDAACIKSRRVGVSAAFFVELEFQRTGSFVYRLFKGGLARRPSYQEFNTDRAQVVEGPNLEATKQALVLAFVQRPEFVQKYSGQTTADLFVDALIASIFQNSGADLTSQRDALRNRYNMGADMNQSRAFALRDAIDSTTFVNAEYNASFVVMQYFGYLKRDPDQGGYLFWLDVLNNRVPGNFRGMVCAFLTSSEYQLRFGSLVTRNDSECAGI